MAVSTSIVRINGFLSSPFPSSIGLSQGSSLSCNAWILLLNPFSLASTPSPSMVVSSPFHFFVRLTYLLSFQLSSMAGLFHQSDPKTILSLLNLPSDTNTLNPSLNAHYTPKGYRLAQYDDVCICVLNLTSFLFSFDVPPILGSA